LGENSSQKSFFDGTILYRENQIRAINKLKFHRSVAFILPFLNADDDFQ